MTQIVFGTMALHNLPEGVSVALTTTSDLSLGVSMCIAILIHNIPEGMVLAVTIYAATGSYKSVLLFTLLNGLMEPLGICSESL